MNILYYPAGKSSEGFESMYIWRNFHLTQPDAAQYWTVLENSRVNGQITALTVSTSEPAHRLYYGVSETGSFETGIFPKKLYRIDNVQTGDSTPDEITPPEFPDVIFSGIDDIAVNPLNGDQLLVACSGYNIPSLFYSDNGGATWTDVSGNLEENPDGTGNGPSVFAVAILPFENGEKLYLAGSSTGLYSTTELAGSGTVWMQESADKVGHTPVFDIDSRLSDKLVVVATHGNGIFAANITPASIPEQKDSASPENFVLKQNYPNPFNSQTRISYSVNHPANVTIFIFNNRGQRINSLVNEFKNAGSYSVSWNGHDLNSKPVPSGIYFYSLILDNKLSASKKMIMTK
jgi:hypothetical protein